MKQKFKAAVLGTMCALVLGPCLSHLLYGENLPDGKGKTEFVHNCTACHRADMVTRVKKTPDEWRKSVDEMASRGTDGTKEDLDNVVLYLDTYFVADKPSPSAPTQSTAPSSAAPASAALNPSQIDHVKSVIAQNGCLVCHRIEQQGMYTGPSLNGLAARRSAAEVEAAIVSPPRTLDPGNTLAQLTTADGKKVSGRILSQDEHTVRVIDASGAVATYSKTDLSQFTTSDTDPMPPYQGRITADDLENLVRYLRALPSQPDSIQK